MKVESFVKDKEGRHDDVSGVFGRVRIVSLKQAEVDDGVGVTHVELEDTSRQFSDVKPHIQLIHSIRRD